MKTHHQVFALAVRAEDGQPLVGRVIDSTGEEADSLISSVQYTAEFYYYDPKRCGVLARALEGIQDRIAVDSSLVELFMNAGLEVAEVRFPKALDTSPYHLLIDPKPTHLQRRERTERSALGIPMTKWALEARWLPDRLVFYDIVAGWMAAEEFKGCLQSQFSDVFDFEPVELF